MHTLTQPNTHKSDSLVSISWNRRGWAAGRVPLISHHSSFTQGQDLPCAPPAGCCTLNLLNLLPSPITRSPSSWGITSSSRVQCYAIGHRGRDRKCENVNSIKSFLSQDPKQICCCYIYIFFSLCIYFRTTPSYLFFTCNLICIFLKLTFVLFLFMRCNNLPAAYMPSISISGSSVRRRYLATDTEHFLIRHTPGPDTQLTAF